MLLCYFCFRTGGGGRRARDYLSSLSRADVTGGSTVTSVGGNGEQTNLTAAASSPLTLSSEDLSSTRSMSPKFNSTLMENGASAHAAAGAANGNGN